MTCMSHVIVHAQLRDSYLHWNSVHINRCWGTTGVWQDWKVQLNIHDIIKAQFITAGRRHTEWAKVSVYFYSSYLSLRAKDVCTFV